MSRENVQLVRAAYDAWNARDFETFRGLLADEIEFSTSGVFPDFDSVYRGPEGMARFYEELLSAWEHFRITIRAIEELDEWVIVSLRFAGRGRASGVDVELDLCHAYHLTDGLCDRLVATRSVDAARGAIANPRRPPDSLRTDGHENWSEG